VRALQDDAIRPREDVDAGTETAFEGELHRAALGDLEQAGALGLEGAFQLDLAGEAVARLQGAALVGDTDADLLRRPSPPTLTGSSTRKAVAPIRASIWKRPTRVSSTMVLSSVGPVTRRGESGLGQ
jgi:hypothetical protein